MSSTTPRRQGRKRWSYLLFILPFVGTLFPQIYNSMTPSFIGIPFYYWYLLLWVFIGGGITIVVYYLTR